MHGLSTLNRLLGKKNKEVSRSTSNLSKSHSNLDSSSQHKKLSPIFNNPPFEQSFRVTIYLPKNQLYVERIGAKTKLEKLMNDVCDSKNLSSNKYELRHPVDMSQVFDNDKTIGEVGLNELRLVLKTESRFNGDFHRFHADDVIKYRSSNIPESVSSSEISRNLNNVSKTSPYSSTNSLNSLDSTGMNSASKAKQQPPVAPIRKKKRMAPRPPSENSIPEQEIFDSTTLTLNVFKEPHSILPRKNFHVSSPQLYNNNNNTKSSTNNNNNIEVIKKSDSNNNQTEMRSISSRLNAITRPSSLYAATTDSMANTTSEIVKNPSDRQRNNSESSEIQSILKDSTFDSKNSSLERVKKKSPAPVPPSRNRQTSKPTPSPRTIQDDMKQQSITEIKELDEQENIINSDYNQKQQVIEENSKDSFQNARSESKCEDSNGNISKVLLNNKNKDHEKNYADGPSSIETTDGSISIQIISMENTSEVKSTSKSSNLVKQQQPQQQKEIRETESVKQSVVSKVYTSQPDGNNGADDETRSTEGEEEEMTVNIYNVTKSCVVTCEKPTMVKEMKTVSNVDEGKYVVVGNNNFVEKESETVIQDERQRSSSPEWTYKLPAPPVLNDTIPVNNTSSPTDRHKSIDGVNGKLFADYLSTVDNETILSDSNTTTASAETSIKPVINERRKTLDETFNVDSTITIKPDSVIDNNKNIIEIITSDLEDGYLGNNNIKSKDKSFTSKSIETNREIEKEIFVENSQRSRIIITRSDSFHSIGQQKKSHYDSKRTNLNALPQRSTSFLSLNHSHKAELLSSKMNVDNVPYNRQKSTSELSISNDVPSLQSLEILKNILNSSRKNSLQDAINTSNNTSFKVENEENLKIDKVEEKPRAFETEPSKDNKFEKMEKAYVEELKERHSVKLQTQKSEPIPTSTVSKDGMKKSETNGNSQWRYSGPPKINFSTWSERPKIEVSVMNDEDYIFGGVSTLHRDSVTRNYQVNEKKSEISAVDLAREKVNESGSATDATKIKMLEKQKPKVLHVEYKKEVNPVELRKMSNSTLLSSNEISHDSKNLIKNKPRPVSLDYTNISKTTFSTPAVNNKNINSVTINNDPNSSTQFVSYNRLTGNHKKVTPIVHGFAKLDNISETQVNVKSLPIANKIVSDVNEKQRTEVPIIPAKPTYLRSTSVGDLNRKTKLTPLTVESINSSNDQYEESPFSQTLRRTGLIEKRLNDDKKTESMFGRVIETPKNNSVVSNRFNNEISDYQVSAQDEKVKIRQKMLPTSLSTPLPPPPPMAPKNAAVATFRKSAPVGEVQIMDARNELLDAIKNFNKDSLRRK